MVSIADDVPWFSMDGYSVSIISNEIQIQNVVLTVKLGTKFNLYDMSLLIPFAEYRPKKFAAISIKINRITALVFSTGIMQATGGKTIWGAIYYAQIYRLMLEYLVSIHRMFTCACVRACVHVLLLLPF